MLIHIIRLNKPEIDGREILERKVRKGKNRRGNKSINQENRKEKKT